MMFHDQSGHIVFEATSTDELPDLTRLVKARASTPEEGFVIIDDLRTATLEIAEPADLRERLTAAGYRSILTVLTRARDQAMGLAFLVEASTRVLIDATWRSRAGLPITSRWRFLTSNWLRRHVRSPKCTPAPSASSLACRPSPKSSS